MKQKKREVKKIKVKIRIPRKFIEPAIRQVLEFMDIGDIGRVFLTGDWNDWGKSQKSAGCVVPASTTEMTLENGIYYVAEVELTRGLHGFKPVVIRAEADENGMAPCIWIACPENGTGEYWREPGDVHANWLLGVKEKK